MLTDGDVERVAASAAALPAAEAVYTEDDFIKNLFETVLDYMLRTPVVVKALEYYTANHWDEIRTLGDLRQTLSRYPDTQAGNTKLATHLWGYKLWTRAHQLRDLVAYFESVGVVDQTSLRAWAHRSEYKRDFQGRVRGLGRAVHESLVMRQGVDTVKPDVHVRRFAEAAVGRPLSDEDVISVVRAAAQSLGLRASELDWRIWEAGQRGALSPTRVD